MSLTVHEASIGETAIAVTPSIAGDQARFHRWLTWEKAKIAADLAVAAEKAQRAAIVELDFAGRVEGTNTIPMPDGRELKCVVETEVKTDFERATSCVAKLGKTPEGAVMAERLFSFKAEVRIGELKKLPAALRKIADKFTEAKPKTPTLKIHEPKT